MTAPPVPAPGEGTAEGTGQGMPRTQTHPIRASTRLVALLGDPVAHSLSPELQNAAFRIVGVDGVYLALRATPETFPHLLRGIARGGGAGNITLPYKEAAFAAVARRTPEAEATGAVNTFWEADGVIHGDNTDVAGLLHALACLAPEGLAGARVHLLGAGGAARAAVVALGRTGISAVHLWNRTEARARALASDLAGQVPFPIRVEATQSKISADLVVNATRLGLHPSDPLPCALEACPPRALLLDLVYHPAETRWVRDGRARGHRAADGGAMLVGQGAAAFSRWWGLPAPVEVMEGALDQVRREHR